MKTILQHVCDHGCAETAISNVIRFVGKCRCCDEEQRISVMCMNQRARSGLMSEVPSASDEGEFLLIVVKRLVNTPLAVGYYHTSFSCMYLLQNDGEENIKH